MKSKKGLQKFTVIEQKINKVLALKQITPENLEQLNETEKTRLFEILTEKIKTLTGIERDNFLKKTEPITNESTKNQLWEYNHTQITWAIATLIQEYGRMPTKIEIALKTGLSRQTVHKHINEYKCHPQYLGEIEQFKFMASKVLAKVFKYAVNGDMRAAKLYLNAVGFINNGQDTNNTLIQNQNNFIQINGMVLSQETVKHLNPEQLTNIETILKAALPQAEALEIKKSKY